MQMITTYCPACGGIYNGRLTSRFITCEYCDTRYALGRKELEALGFVDEDGDGYDDYDSCPPDDRRGSQVSSVPLPEFAREACEKFLKGVDNSYFKSTNKILRGLGIEGEDVYLIHDDTIFGSGKNGFAITQRGLYCRDFGEPTAHFVSWEDFANGERPELDDSNIFQNGTSLCYFTGNKQLRDKKLTGLFNQLFEHARWL